jgi:predicted permease
VATRVSVGASRSQILAQFATEASVAATVATVAGSLLAAALIRVLVSWAPSDIPRIEDARLDLGALAFAAFVTIVATLACVLGPALVLHNRNLDSMLREGVRTAGSRTGRRLQNAFLFAQSALTVAILAIGLMLFLSYRAMLNTDLGFIHRDTLTMNLALRGPQVNPEVRRRFYTQLLDGLRTRAGVTNAAAVLLRPFEGPIGWDTEYALESEAATQDPAHLPKANFEVTTPGYFETVGTALISGRDFTDHDNEASDEVAIVSESMARRIRIAGREPTSDRIRIWGAWRKIVGVTADARYRRVVQTADNIYVPYRQANAPTNYLVVRGHVSPSDLLSLVRKTLKEIDPSQAIAGESTLGQMIERNTARNRFNVSILILFVLGAIVLAAAGIHSVVRESVTVRAKEIALRIALGARRAQLVTQSTRGALLWVLLGELAGVAGALVLGRAAADLLYRISPKDPGVLTSIAVFMFAIAVVSSAVPAWIASGQDPRERLQSD